MHFSQCKYTIAIAFRNFRKTKTMQVTFTKFSWILWDCFSRVSRQLPHNENCPLVRVGIWVKVRVSFSVGGEQTIASEKIFPTVRVRVWLRVSFGIGRQFSSGAIAVEPFSTKALPTSLYTCLTTLGCRKGRVCIGVYILARITIKLQSSLNIFKKHKLHTFIFLSLVFCFCWFRVSHKTNFF